jgi:hypothetical protein
VAAGILMSSIIAGSTSRAWRDGEGSRGWRARGPCRPGCVDHAPRRGIRAHRRGPSRPSSLRNEGDEGHDRDLGLASKGRAWLRRPYTVSRQVSFR